MKKYFIIVLVIMAGVTCWAEEFKSMEAYSIPINMEDQRFTYLKTVYLYDQNGNFQTTASVYETIIGGKRQIYISLVRGAEKYRAEYIKGNKSFNYRVCYTNPVQNITVCFYFKL